MDNIRNITDFRDGKAIQRDIHPQSAEGRFLALPTTPFTQQCEACGNELLSKQLRAYGVTRHAPGRCSCQEDKARQAQVNEQRKVILDAQSRNTYSWLGGTWTDISLRGKTFENFDASKQQKAYDMSKFFIEFFKGCLILDGTYGTGKTHLLAAVCNAALRKEKPVASLFTTSANLFAAIQKRIGANEEYHGIIQKAMSTPLLCLDDIDKTKYTEWREEVYFSIVDERVKRGLPIALSTNKFKELHLYVGGAVASRLKIGQIAIEMNGNDYREGLQP